MELDDFKSTWKKHNTELGEKLVLNVNSLTDQNLSKSQNELFKPFIHEIANIFVIGLTIIFIAIFSFAHLEEIEFSNPGFAAVFLGVINVYYAIVKAHKIYYVIPYSKNNDCRENNTFLDTNTWWISPGIINIFQKHEFSNF